MKSIKRQNVFNKLFIVSLIFGVVPIVFKHITYGDIIGYLGVVNGLGAIVTGKL